MGSRDLLGRTKVLYLHVKTGAGHVLFDVSRLCRTVCGSKTPIKVKDDLFVFLRFDVCSHCLGFRVGAVLPFLFGNYVAVG